MSVHMWVNENEKIVFYYNEYGVLDLNSILNKDVPFAIWIQMEWQIQMMIINANRKKRHVKWLLKQLSTR